MFHRRYRKSRHATFWSLSDLGSDALFHFASNSILGTKNQIKSDSKVHMIVFYIKFSLNRRNARPGAVSRIRDMMDSVANNFWGNTKFKNRLFSHIV